MLSTLSILSLDQGKIYATTAPRVESPEYFRLTADQAAIPGDTWRQALSLRQAWRVIRQIGGPKMGADQSPLPPQDA